MCSLPLLAFIEKNFEGGFIMIHINTYFYDKEFLKNFDKLRRGYLLRIFQLKSEKCFSFLKLGS